MRGQKQGRCVLLVTTPLAQEMGGFLDTMTAMHVSAVYLP